MSLDRYFASLEDWRGAEVVLTDDDSRHCLRVMRKRVGDELEVFDGEGRWGRGVISGEDGGRVRVEVREEGCSKMRPPKILLAVAIPKGKTMELIVQKAVELGVNTIQPLVTERTVVRVEGGEAEKKRGKWQRVALEACKQCGQNLLPAVRAPLALEGWLTTREEDRRVLMASLAEGAVPLREAIGGLPVGLPEIGLLIGPEGDFSERETAAALAAGLQPVSFGEITLRVETAVMFALSVLSYELRLE